MRLVRDASERKAYGSHVVVGRKLMMSCVDVRTVKNIKCSIQTCADKVTYPNANRGSNFCIQCTNLFQCGRAFSGLCDEKHCRSVHGIVENIIMDESKKQRARNAHDDDSDDDIL